MQTKLNYGRSDSKSLRTTVPKAVVDVLKLANGDLVDWSIEAKDSQFIVSVRKVGSKVKTY